MKVHFKHPRSIDGAHFAAKTEHEVSDHLQDHWFFKALVQSGDAVIVEEPKSKASAGQVTEPRESKKENDVATLTEEPSDQASPASKKSNSRNHKGK